VAPPTGLSVLSGCARRACAGLLFLLVVLRLVTVLFHWQVQVRSFDGKLELVPRVAAPLLPREDPGKAARARPGPGTRMRCVQ
jgi:hypothetical protein